MLSKEISDLASERGGEDELGSFTRMFATIRGLSLFNSTIIFCQRPGALPWIYNANQWRSKFNRYVKPESAPIVIVRPGGPVSFLYEPKDTFGDEPLPWYMTGYFTDEVTDEQEEASAQDLVKKYIKAMENYGIAHIDSELGSLIGGSLALLDKPMSVLALVSSGREHVYRSIHTSYAVSLNSSMSSVVTASTIFHELGHLFCGHVGSTDEHPILKISGRSDLSHAQKELEAETTAKILLGRFGIKSPHPDYLDSYKKEYTYQVRDELRQRNDEYTQEEIEHYIDCAQKNTFYYALNAAGNIENMLLKCPKWKADPYR